MKAWSPRVLWGVTLSGVGMLGEGWSERPDDRLSEPSRPLLFRSRRFARAWCEVQHAKYRGRQDCCARWRFQPIRVRESWEIVP